jgi:hypothetical protein
MSVELDAIFLWESQEWVVVVVVVVVGWPVEISSMFHANAGSRSRIAFSLQILYT